jgi:hypothetical protein
MLRMLFRHLLKLTVKLVDSELTGLPSLRGNCEPCELYLRPKGSTRYTQGLRLRLA